MDNCIFCKIIRGEIPSTKVYENDKVYAFRDINPEAPVHILVVPKQHVANILEGVAFGNNMMVDLTEAIAEIAKQEGIDKTGFRVVSNCGKDACQSVEHLHFHVLGGEQLSARMA